MFACDIGLWDVTDPNGVVQEAAELLEGGLLTAAQFREFTCENVVNMVTSLNPILFDGTALQTDVEGLRAAWVGDRPK